MVSKFWSRIARDIEPYVPGEQPRERKYIKLNTNENPYPPSPKVLEAIKQAADESLRLYPDPCCNDLRQTAADYFGLKKEQVFVGNGSDEVLAFSFMAFFDPGKPILFPDITYSFYPVYSQLFNLDYRLIPLNEGFEIPVEQFYEQNGGVIIPNPNAPTSNFLELEAIKEIIEHNSESVVIIDEAYIDFGGESAVKLINEFSNLLVIHTLSKSRSLAGLRVGFAMGQKELIEGLERIKDSINSYTLDRLALAGAKEAILDEEYFQQTRKKIMITRERITEALRNKGFQVIDSRANFIFVAHPAFPGKYLFEQLREKGILVRYFNKPRIDNFLRVSIGTDGEMDIFLKEICEITSSK